ncbi:MAG: hypothetical protein EPO32_04340, partial [Anaerolineae bacterium]
ENIIRPGQPVAEVNETTITTKEFQKRARFVRRFYVTQYLNLVNFLSSGAVDQSFASQYQLQLRQIQFQLEPENLGRQILDDLIEAELVATYAQENGITVTEEEVDQGILGLFFNYQPPSSPTQTPTPTGAPTSTLSATQLALVTITPTIELPSTATAEAGVTVTPTFAFPTPTVQSTETFGEEYTAQLDTLKADVGWTEQDFREYARVILLLDKVKAVVTADTPRSEEQVWARHILVADEAAAQAVLERLAAGEDWAALALELSQDTGNATRGGDLGWFNRETMVAEFGDAAFALEVGEISEPVQTQFGFHIIQVLGHEDRPLDHNAYLAAQDAAFQIWLDDQRAAATIVEYDYWIDRVPTDPAIPPQYILP